MTEYWDEFTKSLAQPVPRRESLRRLGLVVAGALLSPLGTGFAWGKPQGDPCKTFCKCRNKQQQDQCLSACRACGNNPSRLGGSCGNFFCCGAGLTSCGSYCADLSNDPYNCGACGAVCHAPGPYEEGACVDGECRYWCEGGAVVCGGRCTDLSRDRNNCGACGNVCGGTTPDCIAGVCGQCPSGTVNCGGRCMELWEFDWDRNNCGGCGNVCPPGSACAFGVCGTPCIDC